MNTYDKDNQRRPTRSHVVVPTSVSLNPAPARGRLVDAIFAAWPTGVLKLLKIIVGYIPDSSLLPPSAPCTIRSKTYTWTSDEQRQSMEAYDAQEKRERQKMMDDDIPFWFRFTWPQRPAYPRSAVATSVDTRNDTIYHLMITPAWSWYMIWNEIIAYFQLEAVRESYVKMDETDYAKPTDIPRRGGGHLVDPEDDQAIWISAATQQKWLRLTSQGRTVTSFMGSYDRYECVIRYDTWHKTGWSDLYGAWADVMRPVSVEQWSTPPTEGYGAGCISEPDRILMQGVTHSTREHATYELVCTSFSGQHPEARMFENIFYLWPLSTRRLWIESGMKHVCALDSCTICHPRPRPPRPPVNFASIRRRQAERRNHQPLRSSLATHERLSAAALPFTPACS